MNLSTIIVLFIGVVALFFVVEMRRRGVKKLQDARRGNRLSTLADEMDPSYTGRFRVQEMLKRTEGMAKNDQDSESEEEVPLPDPFVSGSFQSSHQSSASDATGVSSEGQSEIPSEKK